MLYIKNNEIQDSDSIIIIKDDMLYISPTHQMLIDDGWEVYTPKEPSKEELLEIERNDKLNQIYYYDISDNVNLFTIDGNKAWLSKQDRVGLVNSLNCEKSLGRVNSIMWFNGIKYTISIEKALAMLKFLELYALDCYNVTEQHKQNVLKIQDLDLLKAYDYTAGYPKKLEFSSI